MSEGSGGIRATIDTNLFVSAAIRAEGHSAQILAAWREDRFVLVTSWELEDEVLDVFSRPQLRRRFRIPVEQQASLLLALVAAEHVTPRYPLPVSIRDPKDEPLLACALGGQADHLVTGDVDLHVLAGNPNIGTLRILTPREFLLVLGITPSER